MLPLYLGSSPSAQAGPVMDVAKKIRVEPDLELILNILLNLILLIIISSFLRAACIYLRTSPGVATVKKSENAIKDENELGKSTT